MPYDPIRRRTFLRGLGGFTLAIPFLPSLAPQALAQAAAGPLRYVQILGYGGVNPSRWYKANDIPANQMQKIADHVYAKPLADMPGAFSDILHSDAGGASFESLKRKMTVIRGLDHTTNGNGHNTASATTGNCAGLGAGDPAPPTYKLSADVVIGRSKYLYGSSPLPKFQYLVLNPAQQETDRSSFTWKPDNGGVRERPILDPVSAFINIFGERIESSNPTQTVDPKTGMRKKVVDLVYADYSQLKNSGQLGAEDKHRLENYMQLMSRLQDSLQIPAGGGGAACPTNMGKPTAPVNMLQRNQDMLKVAAAALACGKTRVMSIVLTEGANEAALYPPGDFHLQYMHYRGKAASNEATWFNHCKWRATRVAEFLQLLDGMSDIGGTLLDRSLVYFGNEFGGKGEHMSFDVPVLVAGGGGKFRLGQYIDYRQRDAAGNLSLVSKYFGANVGHLGRPYNQLLVSFFNAFNIPYAPFAEGGYQQPGNTQGGFGDYTRVDENQQNTITPFPYAKFLPNAAAKQASLPYFAV